MLRRVFLSVALGLAASCAVAQTAPSPADVGISKGTPDVFKLKGHDNAWTPFGSVDPSTHIFAPATNGNIAPNDCIKWGPGLTSAGAACNSVTGGAHPANQLTIYTNHAGLLANVTTPTEAWTLVQQGFYSPGDGGEAVYNWNATSLCPGGNFGTPTATADGFSCILPVGQSAATPGRYILNLTNGSLNARQFGLQPGIGAAFDNSPLLPAIFTAIGPPSFGPNGPDIIFPPTLGQISTTYYFSQPFEVTHGSSINCSNLSDVTGGAFIGNKVGFAFPAGIPGVAQENARLSAAGSGDTGSTIIGCNIISLGKFSSNGAPEGASTITGVGWSAPSGWSGATQTFTPGDGIVAIGLHAINGGPLLRPGSYVQSVAPSGGNQDLTLGLDSTGAQFVVGKQAVNVFNTAVDFTVANIWRLPVNEKRQITATVGVNTAVITGGNRPIKVGEWIWTEAFLFGTIIESESNQVASATVNSGGSGYVGTSGTMTWAGSGCSWGTNPVLNVTASGGVITGVTGVATAGNCNGAWPPNTAAKWTPGGGLSGGGGATFNTVFANHVTMSTMAASSNPSPAMKTGTFNLWTMNAGLTRRVGASTHGSMIYGFPIGLEAYGDAGGGFATGTANSRDEGDSFGGGMIGRYVTGADCAPSLSLHNVYGQNSISDIVESCTLSNVYINENTNSPENDVGKYSILGLCTFNSSTFIGGYLSSNETTDGFCLGTDANGSGNIGVPVQFPEAQGPMLALGTGLSSVASIAGRGDSFGSFRWFGYNGKSEFSTAPVAVGASAIPLTSFFPMFTVGYGVQDVTNPKAIPANTTVTGFPGAGVITISNPVAAPGVATNDRILLTVPTGWNPCVHMTGGADLIFQMSVACDGTGFTFAYNPGAGAWGIDTLLFPAGAGYQGYQSSEDIVVPGGIAVGSAGDGSYVLGQERLIQIDPQPFTNDHHRQGDIRFNRNPVAGGTMQWAYAAFASTSNVGNINVGDATAHVSACPAGIPVGTPIATSYGVGPHIGDFASCSGTTLTFQAPALAFVNDNNNILFMNSFPAARIASDVNGYVYPIANHSTIASLPTCAGGGWPAVGLAVVADGQTVAAAGYGAAVSTTGSSPRPVFCDGTSWTYH